MLANVSKKSGDCFIRLVYLVVGVCCLFMTFYFFLSHTFSISFYLIRFSNEYRHLIKKKNALHMVSQLNLKKNAEFSISGNQHIQ